MYATHHKTGKQIRILQHTTSTWRSNKSLVWLDENSELNESVNRIDIGVVGSRTYETLASKNVVADILVCTDTDDIKWIFEGGSRKVNILLATKKILDNLGLEFFKDKSINNIPYTVINI